ncbi:hypothetical protein AN958_02586, partial [Leucoagaricus sp. SymC.cos]
SWLSTLVALAVAVASAQVTGTYPATPLVSKTGYMYPSGVPYQVDTDLRGNPMGEIVFSQSFNGQWVQVREWHEFMGSIAFCLKTCDPSKPNDTRYCEHELDRIGCAYNAPNNAQKGDNQDFPDVCTLSGQVLTYTQPPETLGPIAMMPYTTRVPLRRPILVFPSTLLYRKNNFLLLT